MAPDAQKDFQRLQRYLTDYFNFWRKGRPQYWNPVVRRQAIELLEVPRPGRWEGFKDPRAAAAGRRGTKRDFGAAFVQEDMNALLHGDLVEDDANGNPRDDLWGPPPVKIARVERENGPSGLRGAAEEGARRIEEANRVAGLRFEKILGWGGLGIAALFAIREPDGRIFKVVCKTDLRADDERSTLGREKEYHIVSDPLYRFLSSSLRLSGLMGSKGKVLTMPTQRMAGAKHIVQRVVLQPPEDKSRLRHRVPGRISLAEVNLGARYEDDDGFLVLDKHAIDDHIQKRHKQVLDKRHDVLFLEFMTGGNLQRCLEKVAQQGVRFPDAVLWRIFHCRESGCYSFRYDLFFFFFVRPFLFPSLTVPSFPGMHCHGLSRQVPTSWVGPKDYESAPG
ncbi:hypothetical protein VTK73DRAFT_7293 [Phialemonium thermophilum]|uniref:Protein kinase domain-containing protein n=1 Tax=Phialemonium thermophilum TaxID=223376 RepID=A0ABR3WF73_9PEZI